MVQSSPYDSSPSRESEKLLDQEADRCVMCGLCLPHCPTYRLTGDESESPRGRIALMRALAKKQLPPTLGLLGHLDRCLTCRACEAVCPSLVPYGRLIDSARAQAKDHRSYWQQFKKYLFHQWILSWPTALYGIGKLIRLFQIIGIDRLAQRSGLLRVLGWEQQWKLVPRLPFLQSWDRFYPAKFKERGKVALFRGCIADVVDQPLLLTTTQLLNQLGYSVHVPSKQVCCGALARHDGNLEESLALALKNISAFTNIDSEAIICTATGCTTSLIEYFQWVQEGKANIDIARDFVAKIQDVNQFLLQISWPSEVTLKPLAKRIAVHDPCSLRYVLKQHNAVYNLLRRIPEADIIPLPNNEQCCGAAGSYMLTQPTLAKALQAEKINILKKIQPDILVTPNIGCSLYLSAGIKEVSLPIEIMHPVQLLAQQIDL